MLLLLRVLRHMSVGRDANDRRIPLSAPTSLNHRSSFAPATILLGRLNGLVWTNTISSASFDTALRFSIHGDPSDRGGQSCQPLCALESFRRLTVPEPRPRPACWQLAAKMARVTEIESRSTHLRRYDTSKLARCGDNHALKVHRALNLGVCSPDRSRRSTPSTGFRSVSEARNLAGPLELQRSDLRNKVQHCPSRYGRCRLHLDRE